MNNLSIPIDTQKTLVIAGPTASGKSSMAIEMAQRYDGEIISADSRQIYRGMDIGTGKVTQEEQSLIPHHLLDIRELNEDYNVTDFTRDAKMLIVDIRSRGKLPIICGGTGFWIQALIDNQVFPAALPNPSLRQELSLLSTAELFAKLSLLDQKRAVTIDRNNPIRLIRAIEIAQVLGKVPLKTSNTDNAKKFFIIALNPPKEILHEKIRVRLDERFEQGMVKEVQRLHAQGVSFERLENFGLEYRWIALFLQNKISLIAMKEKLFFASIHYAKRQLTWLRRFEKQGANIHWL